jgi:multiple sugar transport system permease protein
MQSAFYPQKKVSKEAVYGTCFAGIPVLGFIIFGLIPMIVAVIMAFTDVKFALEDLQWVGFDNFAYALKDKMFWKSVVNTLYFALSMPISLIVALIVSVLLNQDIVCKKLFRTIFFIPYVCSVVAVALMWKWIFDANYGVLNAIITKCGGEPVLWLQNASTFGIAVIIIGVWTGSGFGIILYSAALTKVNPAYYEAAKIDGANSWKCFWNITIPAISPTTFYLVIMGLIGALQEFARIQVISTEAGPNNAGLTVVFYLYREGFSYHDMGHASAVAWLLALLIVGITAINFKLSNKWVSYD